MATRGDIRDAFYSELESLAGTYDVTDAAGNVIDSVEVTADDIKLRDPGNLEDPPEIVYYETYAPVTFNGVGGGPDYVVRDSNGDVIEAHYRGYEEAQFVIFVRAPSEPSKEPIYEAVRTAFGKYDDGHITASSFHEEATDITVGETSDADTGDVDAPIRGDQINVTITFFRNYVLDVENIESVELNVEDANYSIT